MKKITLFLNVILVSSPVLFCMQISETEQQEIPKISGTLARIHIQRSKSKLEALPVLDSKEGKKPDDRSRTQRKRTPSLNFHVVVDGELYRSAQLSPQDLEACIKKYGIESVVSLRKNKNRREEEVASKLLVGGKYDYYHVPMCCHRLPSIESLDHLVHIFKHGRKPILVHCEKGIDRSGEAAALYLYAIKKKSKQEALQQLSPRFGYRVKQYPGKALLIYLLPDNPETIPDWISKTYNPYCYEWCKEIQSKFEHDYKLDLDPHRDFLRDFREGCDLLLFNLIFADNLKQQAKQQKDLEPETDPIFEDIYY